jgi:hypothetical protein
MNRSIPQRKIKLRRDEETKERRFETADLFKRRFQTAAP